MAAQVRLDEDVTDRLDEWRGDDSRAAFVNGVLREMFVAWDTPRPARKSIRAQPLRQIRPTPRRP